MTFVCCFFSRSQTLRKSQRCAPLKSLGRRVGLLFSNGGPRSSTPAHLWEMWILRLHPGKSGFTCKVENYGAGTTALSLSFLRPSVLFSVGKPRAGLPRPGSHWALLPSSLPTSFSAAGCDFGAPTGDECILLLRPLEPCCPLFLLMMRSIRARGKMREAAWSLRTPVIKVPTPVPVFSEVVIRWRFVIDTYINR